MSKKLKKSARIGNLKARIMQLEHVMVRAISCIPDDQAGAIAMLLAAYRDDSITREGEWNDDSLALRELARKHPLNHRLGPWKTPRSFEEVSDKLKAMSDGKTAAMREAALKLGAGMMTIRMHDDGFQHPDEPVPTELPEWITNPPRQRGVVSVDEYPSATTAEEKRVIADMLLSHVSEINAALEEPAPTEENS